MTEKTWRSLGMCIKEAKLVFFSDLSWRLSWVCVKATWLSWQSNSGYYSLVSSLLIRTTCDNATSVPTSADPQQFIMCCKSDVLDSVRSLLWSVHTSSRTRLSLVGLGWGDNNHQIYRTNCSLIYLGLYNYICIHTALFLAWLRGWWMLRHTNSTFCPVDHASFNTHSPAVLRRTNLFLMHWLILLVSTSNDMHDLICQCCRIKMPLDAVSCLQLICSLSFSVTHLERVLELRLPQPC